MTELFNKAMVYKLAILIAILFVIQSLATTITAAFLHVDWSSLTGSEKFVLIWIIVGNASGTILAFLNKTLSRMEQGKFPLETGDTVQITKEQTIVNKA